MRPGRPLARACAWALVPLLCALSGCVRSLGNPRSQLQSAARDLAAAGFGFEADVGFGVDRYGNCDGVSCADVVLYKGRRTIMVASDAFESRSRLRAALLEIWERYRQPHPGSVRDLARGALRVTRDGARAGVQDVEVLRRAHHGYRRFWLQLPEAERGDLPAPDAVPFPRPLAGTRP